MTRVSNGLNRFFSRLCNGFNVVYLFSCRKETPLRGVCSVECDTEALENCRRYDFHSLPNWICENQLMQLAVRITKGTLVCIRERNVLTADYCFYQLMRQWWRAEMPDEKYVLVDDHTLDASHPALLFRSV